MWQKGVNHSITDGLSRAPVQDPQPEDLIDEEEVQCHVRALKVQSACLVGDEDKMPESHLVDQNVQRLKAAASSDMVYQLLLSQVEGGFPDSKTKLLPELSPYWSIRDSLFIDDGLVLHGRRIIIPVSQRRDVLERLHASHQGIEKTRRRAQQTVFWPGISADITNTVGACRSCQERLPSLQKEPYLCDPLPAVPFAEVGVDLFQSGGKDFLAAVDRLSGWPLVWPLRHSTTTSKIITHLRRMFVDYGVPARLRSDGASQFTSKEFKDFMDNWGVEHQLSSPHYPQSNGLAESAGVKTMKDLVAKCSHNGVLNEEELCRGLIEFRNTPRQCGQSPAQIVYNRDIKSIVPQMPMTDSWIAVQERKDSDLLDVQEHYNRSAKELPELSPGTQVFIQNDLTRRWDKVGVVVEKLRYRSYLLRLPSGRTWVRNRRFIRAKKQSTAAEPEDQEPQVPRPIPPPRPSRQKKQPDRLGYF